MCGIAGILSNGNPETARTAVERMTAAMRRRGPDDKGLEQLCLPHGFHLTLGHTRLAILDLSAAGRQPMRDEDSGCRLVYNGEIYNHLELRKTPALRETRWKSRNDGETLLRGWAAGSAGGAGGAGGADFIEKLRGMFAFAVWEPRRKELTLVRDHLGIKPLYLARLPHGAGWAFASEVRALLAGNMVERRLSPAALHQLAAWGCPQEPQTAVTGVRTVPPGTLTTISLSEKGPTVASRRWWTWPEAKATETKKDVSFEEAVERTRDVLQRAFAAHMLADVPVGVFLSGGLDSGTLTAVLTKAGFKLKTFSLVFRAAAFDESPWSRATATRFGTEHHEILLEPEELLCDLDEALAAYDQPSFDGLNSWFVSRAAKEAGVKAALSGLGGDEIFAGYPSFRDLPAAEKILSGVAGAPARLLLRLLDGPDASRARRKAAALSRARNRLHAYAVRRRLFDPAGRRKLLAVEEPWPGEPSCLEPETAEELRRAAAGLDPVNAVSLLECSLYLRNMLLRDADQMSMAHSLEVRVPFLDRELLEATARLPGRLKLAPRLSPRYRRTPNKPLEAACVRGLLPKHLPRRPKTGFVFPWAEWLRGPLKKRVADVLKDDALVRRSGLHPASTAQLWNKFLDGASEVRYSEIMMPWILLDWCRRHEMYAGEPED